jgi:hypothetical protein
MGMSPAKFHEPYGLTGTLSNLREKGLGQMGISKFIDPFHVESDSLEG